MQIEYLISRIANKLHGLKKLNLVQLVQAFITRQMMYVVQFLAHKKDEQGKQLHY